MVQALLLILLMFALIFLGVPICFCFSSVAITGILMIGTNPINLIPQGLFGGMNSFTFLAIPFFVFAGELMNYGGITRRLVRLSSLLIGRIKASLAHVNIVASMFFGGITGSAVADTSSIGGMLIPAMIEEGYNADYSVAVTCSSSIIGPIIPPSIVMVVYGAATNTSIGAMFLGGAVPGLLVGFSLMGVVALQSIKREFPRRTEKYTKKEAVSILLQAIAPLFMPVIILGGILTGIFTPSEAGAVSSAYSFLYIVVTHKDKKRFIKKDLPAMLLKTARTSASILFIMGNATIIARVFAYLRVQQSVSGFIGTYLGNRFAFLLFVILILLFMGTFMEGNATVILLAPILAPIAKSFGINPVQFGIIMCMMVVIGNATPPVGVCLFIGCDIGKVSIWDASKQIAPFILAEIAVVALCCLIPQLTLALPHLAGLV